MPAWQLVDQGSLRRPRGYEPILLLFGLLLLLGGRAMASSEEAFLLDFVRQTLDARPATQGEVTTGTVS